MTFLNFGLAYLLCFRLAIVAAGIVSMVLGYKLLCKGLAIAWEREGNTAVEASVGGMKLAMKNAAPGTVFAFFGAGLLIVMIVQSNPSVTYEMLSKWRSVAPGEQAQQGVDSEKVILRGTEQDSISMLTEQGIEYEKRGDMASAERSYQKAVRAMAEPINDLAWRYLQSGRARDAIGLATIAAQLDPGEPRYKDTEEKARKAAQ